MTHKDLSREELALCRGLPRQVRQALALTEEVKRQVEETPRSQDPVVKRSTLRKLTCAVKYVALDRAKATVRQRKQHEDLLKRLRNSRNLIRRYQLQITELRVTIRDLKEGGAEEPKDFDTPIHTVHIM